MTLSAKNYDRAIYERHRGGLNFTKDDQNMISQPVIYDWTRLETNLKSAHEFLRFLGILTIWLLKFVLYDKSNICFKFEFIWNRFMCWNLKFEPKMAGSELYVLNLTQNIMYFIRYGK